MTIRDHHPSGVNQAGQSQPGGGSTIDVTAARASNPYHSNLDASAALSGNESLHRSTASPAESERIMWRVAAQAGPDPNDERAVIGHVDACGGVSAACAFQATGTATRALMCTHFASDAGLSHPGRCQLNRPPAVVISAERVRR
ncbi:MAG: hypothetical protein ACT4N7_20790 [Actinokineospora sp.]